MNTKATVIYWTLFVIIAAVGLVFFFSGQDLISVQSKGLWSVNFLQQNYLPAEKELLQIHIIAGKAGRETALVLAENGGFFPLTVSPCGAIGEVNLWNQGERWCFPDIRDSVSFLTKEKLADQLPEVLFSTISYDKTIFYGRGDTGEIKTDTARYFFDRSFAVDIGYSFEEYVDLQSAAQILVTQCRTERDLPSCLEQNLPVTWKYHSCPSPEPIPSNLRTLDFCVLSTGVQPDQFPIQYEIALDFTPLEIFSVAGITAAYDGDTNTYEIRFLPDNEAEEYTIYYTNWKGVQGKSGSIEDIFSDMPAGFGLYQKSITLENTVELNCPVEKEKGKVYLCVEGTLEVVYVLSDQEIVSGETYLTVTSNRDGGESAASGFIPLME